MNIRITRFHLLLFFAMLFAHDTFAQGFLKASGKNIVNGKGEEVILRGMGLGGWMLMEGYMMQTSSFANPQYQIKDKIRQVIGPADTEAFFDDWLANHVRQIDIDSLKAWGFNSVRLPMHYNLYTLPIEQEPIIGSQTWLEKGFRLTDSLLSWCAKNEMYLILDLHAAPGGQGKEAAISDYDPTKPSLWESDRNKAKTVALWRKLAERYASSQWIGGYDLINETNWTLPGNTALRNLYLEITDAIRELDKNHIIFIEGNWFANDFTGLTPPWDNNMVYSFHKYWSTNDQGSIQWVLDIRNNHNVPLWLGESGENSNTWFRDAIKLAEDNKIGWAWWPMKKIESISGPLSIVKTPGYQTLLNFWSGTGPQPNAATAKAILMDLADKAKLENCVYQKDVIDAMFRQVKSDEAKPWKIQQVPGVVYCSEFDLGANEVAYFDQEVANYHLSSGNYTAWNNGWIYRNDGVDIEPCQDFQNNNGYNVGWITDKEWMLYTVNISTAGVYDLKVRVASQNAGGRFHLQLNGADLFEPFTVAATGGWQTWNTITVKNVALEAGLHKLKFIAGKGGFNLNNLEFIWAAPSNSIPTTFVSGETAKDKYSITVDINKPLSKNFPLTPAGFILYLNDVASFASSVEVFPSNARKLLIRSTKAIRWSDDVKLTYNGVQVVASDGTILQQFDKRPLLNTVSPRHLIPGKIEAEHFSVNNGFVAENCTDIGGGQNMGFTHIGDYLDYLIDVEKAGVYRVDYRVAALSKSGRMEMQLLGPNDTTTLHVIDLPVTGGWQTWQTVSKNAIFPKGEYTLRFLVKATEFNVNWFSTELLYTDAAEVSADDPILRVFPNPGGHQVKLSAQLPEPANLEVFIINSLGQAVYQKSLINASLVDDLVETSSFPSGIYTVTLRSKNKIITSKLVIN